MNSDTTPATPAGRLPWVEPRIELLRTVRYAPSGARLPKDSGGTAIRTAS